MVQHMDRKYAGVQSSRRHKERHLTRAEESDSVPDGAPGRELRLMVHQMPEVDDDLLRQTLRPRAAGRRIKTIQQETKGPVSKRQQRRAKRLVLEVANG